MKKPQETKAVLRQQLEAARAEREQLEMERDAAHSQIALANRRVDEMRRERESESRIIRRIVDLINLYQPSSALLPESLRIMKPDRFDPKFTRMTPPRGSEFDFTQNARRYDPLDPIILNDLLVYIERNYDEWNRLVKIEYRPTRPGLETAQYHIKLSEETLGALLVSRERFCEEIGRMAAVALYAHLIESKS